MSTKSLAIGLAIALALWLAIGAAVIFWLN
jgi:hypothetical protein